MADQQVGQALPKSSAPSDRNAPLVVQRNEQLEVMRRLLRHPLGLTGGTIVLIFLVLALAAPLIAPFSPTEQPSRRLLAPSGTHILGTDEFGRDILSRIIFGSRISLQVGGISVVIALFIGGILGLVAGYFRGEVDGLIMRVVDIMFAFPGVILIIALAGILGASITTAMFAIGVVYAPLFARVVRGPTLTVMQQQYIEGARVVGASSTRIILRYVLPNIAAPIIVQATLLFSTAVLAEATLSFLGLGTQPPDPSWGTMLGSGRRYMEQAPWVAIWPGVAITLMVLGLNLLGDALRDALDPRLRSS
jgi:peptide/nickel transport system permease protein